MTLYETRKETEGFLLVGINESVGGGESALNELESLLETAGGISLGRILQNREKAHPSTYVGKGKLEEIAELLTKTGADGIVCDDELTPAQMKNLQSILSAKIMDRTMLILEIFAQRAASSEGKIQVELAQLKYRAVRLVGLRASLSRLGGGIGTRGPGEKKLEMDRRLIHERISWLKKELEQVIKHRELSRKNRNRNNRFIGALVGYTNAGKSSLLNTLTGSDVLAQDKLFATLDPTTRKMESDKEILLTDTVGFIRKLPHHLIEAFRSTLEEAKYADVILHVADASDPEMDTKMLVVYDTLKSLNIKNIPVITVYNKMDMAQGVRLPRDFHADHQVRVSAKTSAGLDELKGLLEKLYLENRIYLEKIFDYKDAARIAEIRKKGEILSEEYREDGIQITARVPHFLYDRMKM